MPPGLFLTCTTDCVIFSQPLTRGLLTPHSISGRSPRVQVPSVN